MMYVDISGKTLLRRLPWLMLLVVLALLRAERGVAEVQGATAQPGRLLHLAPEPDGEGWALSLLGHQSSLQSRLVLLDSGGPLLSRETISAWVAQMKQALP